jgi:acyl-CoA thioester hydrolase
LKPVDVFTWPVRVYYEDTDAAGVVYYANYLRFLERARTEWLCHLGFELSAMRRIHQAVFVVRRLSVDYVCPARLGDALVVSVDLRRQGYSKLQLRQDVSRDDTLLCSAEVTLACLHAESWRPVAMPRAIAQKFEEIA